jgi:competence protein ComEC
MPPVIGIALATPGWVALRTIIGIVDVAAALPLASVSFEPPVGLVLALVTAGTAAVAVLTRKRQRPRRGTSPLDRPRDVARTPRSRPLRLASAALVVAVAVAGAVAISRPAGVARVTVLDVGQGDAILVEGPRGGRLLVDGGPDPDRLLVALDRRIPAWDRRIDAVILSHPHEDHVAGLALLLDRYEVGRVFEPGMRGPGPGYAAWLDRIGGRRPDIRLSLAAGDRLTVDDIGLRVLWPIRGSVPTEPPDSGTGINNVSVVLLGTVGEQRFLLAGDVEEEVDPTLLAAGLPTVDMLKVAHHGSRTATTDAFIEAVRPRVAVASAGIGNRYGHPAPATLDRLANAGARVFRTDRDGSVTVSFDDGGMSVDAAPRPTAARASAASARLTAVPTSFLCAVPIQPFVGGPPTGTPELPPRHGTSTALGYHPADVLPPLRPGRCPAMPPPDLRRTRLA